MYFYPYLFDEVKLKQYHEIIKHKNYARCRACDFLTIPLVFVKYQKGGGNIFTESTLKANISNTTVKWTANMHRCVTHE